jgi:hypothetical protein
MERRKTSVGAFLGIAIRGGRWRCRPASAHCVPCTVAKENNPAPNFSATVLLSKSA